MSGLIGGAGAKSGIIGETELEYEEVTWTPAMVGSSGSAGSWSMGGVEADYIRVGKLVYITMYCYVANKGDYTGNLKVTGLPFANTGFANVTSLAVGGYPFNNTTNNYHGVIPGGQSFIRFMSGVYTETVMTMPDVYTGRGISMTGFYHLA